MQDVAHIAAEKAYSLLKAEREARGNSRAKRVPSQGRTVLFVSHNMASIRKLCKSCIVLENGRMALNTDVNSGIEYYMRSSNRGAADDLSTAVRTGRGSGLVHFTDIKILDDRGEETLPSCGRDFVIRLFFDVHAPLENVDLSVDICDKDGTVLCTFPMHLLDQQCNISPGKQSADLFIPRCPLSPGRYLMNVYAAERNGLCDFVESAAPLDVQNDDFYKKGRMIDHRFWGRAFCCDYEWQNVSLSSPTH